ncbi:MAG TPA: invasion associated locus B family protein [Xanthobacteraceae bacterium]|nr:invasion associated locus B family protein [Xanthobacteraceae bacterium]
MTTRPFFTCLAASLFVISLPFAGLAQTTTQPSQTPAKKDTKQAAKPKDAPPTQPGTAAAPSLIAQYGDWGVYVSQTPKTKVCYALSQPKERQPAGLKRDPGYFFISTRPGESVKNEVSFVVGFTTKENTDATIDIGGAAFSFFTKHDGAWLKNAAEETQLVEALRNGHDLTVKSTSQRGNATNDRYSLSGLPQALDRVAQECQ